MYRLRNTQKQKILLQQDRAIFRSTDLAILWGINNKNTLWKTLSRYVQREILHPIYKGLYSTVPLEKLNKYELGCAICGPLSYVSTETVLQNEGVIMQNVNKITLLGSKNKELNIKGVEYLCRYINSKYLLNRKGIIERNGFSIATLERAIADMQYLSPKYYFDNKMAIDLDKVNEIKKEVYI